MCWSCNPLCCRCKPPKRKAVTCPSCGRISLLGPDECLGEKSPACKTCGADLAECAEIKPVSCLHSGLECAWPCGKAKSAPKDGKPMRCPTNTPVPPHPACRQEETAHHRRRPRETSDGTSFTADHKAASYGTSAQSFASINTDPSCNEQTKE